MSNVFITVYTKEHGRQELTYEEWSDYDGDVVTYHRLDGPAKEYPNGYKEWWVNGKLHRLDGPAIECADGDKYWYTNGKRHRLDGPAREHASGYKAWYANGGLHRTDGPAIEHAGGNKEWYLEDIEYIEEEFKIIINKYKQLPRSIKMSHELWWVREL